MHIFKNHFTITGCSVEGHVVRETSIVGDGEKCLTGHKVLCCPGLSGAIGGLVTQLQQEIGLGNKFIEIATRFRTL